MKTKHIELSMINSNNLIQNYCLQPQCNHDCCTCKTEKKQEHHIMLNEAAG